MMNKHAYYGICGIALAVSASIMAYCQFILNPISAETYQIFPLQTLHLYAAKPLFWLCLGLVFSLAFVQAGALRKIFFRAGLALAAAYALCAVCWCVGVPVVRFIYPVIRLAEAAPVFFIPGVLIGAGLEKAEFKH